MARIPEMLSKQRLYSSFRFLILFFFFSFLPVIEDMYRNKYKVFGEEYSKNRVQRAMLDVKKRKRNTRSVG